MADYVVPRHTAVMERLRRRIELFRRHHNNCENRYDSTAMERRELDRQQTITLHQRCLQTKAKRSNKHRQTQSGGEQQAAVQRATGAGNADHNDGGGGGAPGEQSRNNTRNALHETVKRKLEAAGSPHGREQVNGFGDGYPPSKKSCLEDAFGGLNGTSNGAVPPLSPLDSKIGLGPDALALNGKHAMGSDQNGTGLPDGCGSRASESDIRLKEMKQEPVDDILPTGGGNGNIILPDLNLNEQEWTELMEEFNRSVPYEEISELFSDGFEDRKDPDLVTSVTSGGAVGHGLLHPDLGGAIKAEFSPAPASSAFEQDSRTGSPHIPQASSGSQMLTGSPVTAPPPPSSASSPALPGSQHPQQQQQQQGGQQSRLHQNHLLPGPPKDLSPAQQLQQLAAREQQRAQLIQSQKQQQQQQQQQQVPTFHQHQQSTHPSPWPPNAPPTQTPVGSTFGLEKPTSPSLYPSDFQNHKSLLKPSKGSPKAPAPGGYLQPGGHPMLGHPSAVLGHPPGPGGQAAMLSYSNTKPLTHYEAGEPGPPHPPRGQGSVPNQNKEALISLLRQQQMKQRPTGMPYRPPTTHLPQPQEPGTYPSAPHVPGPGGAAMATQANAHGNVVYMQKAQQQQQQMMNPQAKPFFMGQQQRQMLAEQEKQREQQLQRHLTRPPPQYQDQQNPSAQQNPFQQQPQVSQFPGSSQPMGGVNPLGGPVPGPGPQRMFPQAAGMMGMGQGGGPTPGGPPNGGGGQADMGLSSCPGGQDVQHVLYGNMPMHPAHGNPQRMPMSAAYRQNLLAQQQQQQQHLKNQPNAAMLKQQQLARMPNNMANTMPSAMAGGIQHPASMQPQPQPWQQQQPQQQHPALQQGLPGQPNPNNAGFPASSFHMQQPRMAKMPNNAPFGQPGRAMTGMNPGQMMPGMAQQRTNGGGGMGTQLPPPPPNQQQQQQQQTQTPQAQTQSVLPDLGPFGQAQGVPVPNRNAAGMPCNQAYQVNRTVAQQQQQPPQQQLPFGYNAQSGGGLPSFPVESDLMDSLLKNQTTQEWMDDLDELLAGHQ